MATEQNKKCREWKGNILKFDNVMKFMLHNMRKIGCGQEISFICQPCEDKISGHYEPGTGVRYQVILCENHLTSEEQTAETMIHETIHAFDDCRVEMNWNDCRHHACSEIRAANLSGDCGIFNEFARGFLLKSGFRKHHQECVKRRALTSIRMNPGCAGIAEKTIDEIFEICMKDTEPFDEVY